MKFKVGDIVKLKSEEELKNLSWSKYLSKQFDGVELKILGIACDCYISIYDGTEIHFADNCIKELIDDSTYTFDELKKRVDALKEYATRLSSELNVGLSIEVYSKENDFGYGKEYKGSSKVKIID